MNSYIFQSQLTTMTTQRSVSVYHGEGSAEQIMSDFEEILQHITDPAVKNYYTELLNTYPISNSEVKSTNSTKFIRFQYICQEETPLKMCARIGDQSALLARLLLEKLGADTENFGNVYFVKSKRRTPLHVCAQYNSIEVAKLLLAYGANVNSVDADVSFCYKIKSLIF